MSFLHPYLLYLMLLIPVLVVSRIFVHKAKSQQWKKIVAARLSKELVTRKKNYLFWVSYALLMISLACFIVALARPYKGEVKSFDKVKSRNIMFMMDASKSMLCQDITPDRLTAAKSLSLQLLKSFPNDHVGVIAFAGGNHMIAPLTVDHAAVHDSLAQLDTESVALEGSNLAEAALKGIEALKNTGQRANALVIFSDGTESDEGISKVVQASQEANVQIFCVGIGTPAGGVIPSDEDISGKHRNSEGQVVHTRLEAKVLRRLAESTSGIYTSIDDNPDKTISAALDKMKQFEQEGRERLIPNELYMWFLAPGVFLLLASTLVRTKWRAPKISAPALAALLLAIPHFVQGAEWWDKTKEKYLEQPAREQQGYKNLQKQEYEDALSNLQRARSLASGEKHAELSQAIGEIQFRLGNYSQAASEYSTSLLSEAPDSQQSAYYNIGNALYQQQWSKLKVTKEQSLEDYLVKAVEKTDPENIPPLEMKDLDTLEKGFNNALAKYNDSLSILPQDKASLNNKQLTEKNIQEIQKARQRLNKKEEEKKQDEQQQKDDQSQDNKSEGDQKKNNQEQKDQQKGNQQKDDQSKNNESEGDQKSDQQNKGDQPEESDTPENPNRRNQQKDQHLSPEELAKNIDPSLNKEERARKMLELHSDLQKPPGEARNAWRRKPEIDW